MNDRRFPRFRVSGVRGKVSFAERVEIINMSASGIAFKTDRRLEIGREHKLIIEGKDFSVNINGDCRVVEALGDQGDR